MLTGRFYRCNPRHHTLALIGVPDVPKRLHHIMFETNALDAVGAAFDRADDRICMWGHQPVARS